MGGGDVFSVTKFSTPTESDKVRAGVYVCIREEVRWTVETQQKSLKTQKKKRKKKRTEKTNDDATRDGPEQQHTRQNVYRASEAGTPAVRRRRRRRCPSVTLRYTPIRENMIFTCIRSSVPWSIRSLHTRTARIKKTETDSHRLRGALALAVAAAAVSRRSRRPCSRCSPNAVDDTKTISKSANNFNVKRPTTVENTKCTRSACDAETAGGKNMYIYI